MNSLLLDVAFSKIFEIGIANDGSISLFASGFEIATQILLLLEPSGTEYLCLVNPISTGVKGKDVWRE